MSICTDIASPRHVNTKTSNNITTPESRLVTSRILVTCAQHHTLLTLPYRRITPRRFCASLFRPLSRLPFLTILPALRINPNQRHPDPLGPSQTQSPGTYVPSPLALHQSPTTPSTLHSSRPDPHRKTQVRQRPHFKFQKPTQSLEISSRPKSLSLFSVGHAHGPRPRCMIIRRGNLPACRNFGSYIQMRGLNRIGAPGASRS
ncbi:hypothetical protein FA13DRAFT_1302529 [Coprinellus micaceus]|uniref:Uncharacterized protein n=1 Tax=Coprinellus micaceus TaxID=71717 RepID=A0A4Y7R511_COPMI|nr:hypothetical protein FA13DRAFT_1302529 [Coprinellus micaceus]